MTDAVLVDLDGTLAFLEGRNPYDPEFSEEDSLNEKLAKTLNNLHEEGKAIIIVTGREKDYKTETQNWLKKHDIPYQELLMRPSSSQEENITIKEKYLQQLMKRYDVVKAYDDLPEVINMYRKYGIDSVKI